MAQGLTKVDAELRRVLLLIAQELDSQRCSQCEAHNEHDQCDAPGVAEAIRKVVGE